MSILNLILLVFTLSASPLNTDLPQIRKDYYAAVNSEKAADKFHQRLKNMGSDKPVIQAYYGSSQAIRARHAINPYNKMKFLSDGLKTLQLAVNNDPENLEIRFLRFSLQHYVPSFLGMSKELTMDKAKIVSLFKQKMFGTLDETMLKGIVSFMKESKRCSVSEIAVLDRSI